LNHILTLHADQRCRERGITPDNIGFILEHAKREHRGGVVFCQMRDKDMPDRHLYQRLRGVTVVLCRCESVVITVYKNPEAFKKDRRKRKYDIRSGYGCCPNCNRTVAA
jgi:hypothetical protein